MKRPIVIIFIVAIVLSLGYLAQRQNKGDNMPVIDKRLESVMAREQFKKAEKNRAMQIIATEDIAGYKAELEAIQAEYKAKIDAREADLEALRAEEMSFQ